MLIRKRKRESAVGHERIYVICLDGAAFIVGEASAHFELEGEMHLSFA